MLSTFFIIAKFFARGCLTASTQLYGGVHIMNYYALDNRVTGIHMYAFEGNDTSQEEADAQKGLDIYG